MTPDQPKPTGEWTAETVANCLNNRLDAAQVIADAHNAAVAAEQEKVKDAQEEAFAAYAEGDALRVQLAAEREQSKRDWTPGFVAAYKRLEKELAAEREKMKRYEDALREVNALARGNMTGCGTCNHIIDTTIKVL